MLNFLKRLFGASAQPDNQIPGRVYESQSGKNPWLPQRSTGFVMPASGLADLIRKYARLCQQQPEIDDETINAKLSIDNVTPELAYHVTVFTPIAFTHFLLQSDVKFSPNYIVMHPQTHVTREYPILTHPVYQASYYLAPELRDTLRTVAVRSVESRVISKALQAGSELSNLLISPPVIMTTYSMHELPD